jgi:ribonuclease R
VSHYVRDGDALDQDARERGTSVYFPRRVIPMLPEALSNELCSLKPDVDRLCMVCDMDVSAQGLIRGYRFHRAVMHSRARLTYNKVWDWLSAAERKEKLPDEARPLMPHLANLYAVYQALAKSRGKRGAIDFDTVEMQLEFDVHGKIVRIVPAARNEAHRLIEEFMLAANEAVAKHLQFVPTPAVYRVHDRPDESKLADLRVALEPFGYELPEDEEEVEPALFQQILDEAAGTPEERFVSELVLRAQKKAIYSPECRGHYALAAKFYCHFTSPIRRYPDLLVHRALSEWIETRRPPAGEEAERRTKELTDASRVSSERERRAESAEREALAWKKFVFLSKRVNEEFDAYVSAVVPFGLFIVLDEIYVDGLVPMDALEDDFYRYEELEHRLVGASTGRVYRLGDLLRVKLTKVDFDRRELGFAPVGDSAGPRRRSRVEAIQRRQQQRSARGTRAPRRR